MSLQRGEKNDLHWCTPSRHLWHDIFNMEILLLHT